MSETALTHGENCNPKSEGALSLRTLSKGKQMRNHPAGNAASNRPSDGVLLQFDKRDAEIVRNWSKAAFREDLPDRKN